MCVTWGEGRANDCPPWRTCTCHKGAHLRSSESLSCGEIHSSSWHPNGSDMSFLDRIGLDAFHCHFVTHSVVEASEEMWVLHWKPTLVLGHHSFQKVFLVHMVTSSDSHHPLLSLSHSAPLPSRLHGSPGFMFTAWFSFHIWPQGWGKKKDIWNSIRPINLKPDISPAEDKICCLKLEVFKIEETAYPTHLWIRSTIIRLGQILEKAWRGTFWKLYSPCSPPAV